MHLELLFVLSKVAIILHRDFFERGRVELFCRIRSFFLLNLSEKSASCQTLLLRQFLLVGWWWQKGMHLTMWAGCWGWGCVHNRYAPYMGAGWWETGFEGLSRETRKYVVGTPTWLFLY